MTSKSPKRTFYVLKDGKLTETHMSKIVKGDVFLSIEKDGKIADHGNSFLVAKADAYYNEEMMTMVIMADQIDVSASV